MNKRFIISYKNELDNGLSGFNLNFVSVNKESVLAPNSKSKVLVNSLVSKEKEAELRSKIQMLGLKTDKWFTKEDTSLSVGKVKSKLGYTILGRLFGS